MMTNAPVFVTDMALCTGCLTCIVACKDRAGLPDAVDWIHLETYERGSCPKVALCFRVVHCFHCAEPPCAAVCPVEAISRSGEGWVRIDRGTCIGCRQCLEACPFEAIVIGNEGIATKCDGCADEVARELQPTCIRACPMGALSYGTQENRPDHLRMRDPDFSERGVGARVLYLRGRRGATAPR